MSIKIDGSVLRFESENDVDRLESECCLMKKLLEVDNWFWSFLFDLQDYLLPCLKVNAFPKCNV